jgi:ABC-type uncharacterized transport system involved in gliding motility auxiliary subunit
MDGRIFGLRNRPDEVFGLNFDNVTFVLNILDSLAGDDRFLEIRKRKPKHRTLERIEDTVAAAREKAEAERQKFIARSQASIDSRNRFSTAVGSARKSISQIDSSMYGSISLRSSQLRSRQSTSSGSGW